MNTFLLWFDGSQTSLAEKVRKAAAYYQKKYDRKPDLCLVHPSMLGAETLRDVDGILVRPWRGVIPKHLWIGIEENNIASPAALEPETLAEAQA